MARKNRLEEANRRRLRWKPRHPLGEWVYFDPVKGPAMIRAYLPDGYILTILTSHVAFYGMPHQVHKWTKVVQQRWEKQK